MGVLDLAYPRRSADRNSHPVAASPCEGRYHHRSRTKANKGRQRLKLGRAHRGNSSQPVSLPPQLGCWSTAPCAPHLPQRAARRSRSLEAFGLHLMIHGASAVGARCRQGSHTSQNQGAAELDERWEWEGVAALHNANDRTVRCAALRQALCERFVPQLDLVSNVLLLPRSQHRP
jgi:hypothetical protein